MVSEEVMTLTEEVYEVIVRNQMKKTTNMIGQQKTEQEVMDVNEYKSINLADLNEKE